MEVSDVGSVSVAKAGFFSDGGAAVAGIAGGAAFTVIGLVMAFDYKGFATLHSRLSLEFVRPAEKLFRHVPPWRWTLRTPFEERVRRQMQLERLMGWVFAVVGVTLSLASLIRLVGWAVTR